MQTARRILGLGGGGGSIGSVSRLNVDELTRINILTNGSHHCDVRRGDGTAYTSPFL